MTTSDCLPRFQQLLFYLFDSNSVETWVLTSLLEKNLFGHLKGLTFWPAALSRLLLDQIISRRSRVAARSVATQLLTRIVCRRAELAGEDSPGRQGSLWDSWCESLRGSTSLRGSGSGRDLLSSGHNPLDFG
jgi:hypothetical protein